MAQYREDSQRNYEDIIGLEHPVSQNHPPMDRLDRAVQFSPFAALTGYEEALKETERLTYIKRELGEDEARILDEKLRIIDERIGEGPEVSVTYFEPDERKTGGRYITVKDVIKRIDHQRMELVLEKGTRILAREITGLESDIFPPQE